MDRKQKIAIYVVIVIVIVVLLYLATRSPTKHISFDGAYIDLADGSEVLVVSKGKVVTFIKSDGIKTFIRRGSKLGDYDVAKKKDSMFLMDGDVCVMALQKDEDFVLVAE